MIHTGTAGAHIGGPLPALARARRDDLGEEGKHVLTQLQRGVDVLQTPQDLWNVVARFRVELDGRDALRTERLLRIDDLTH